ncbi:MAG: TolC family outer membrane protein [Geminicoccaceae bacterium]|nr:TolC family outer membrane protein [Geminicoccaceae bacterium]
MSIGPSWARSASILACLLIPCASGLPTSAAATTLDQAFVDAYLENPRLRAGRAQLRATDELVPQALSGYRPTVEIDGSLEGVSGQTDRGDIDRLTTGAALSLRQNLYAGGGTQALVDASLEVVAATRAQLLSLEQTVLTDVVAAYSAVWRDRVVLELALANASRLDRQLQATRDRFSVGEVARTDVAQAQARVAGARSDIEQARADLAASVAAYRAVIGEDPQDLAEPEPAADLPASPEAAFLLAATNPEVVAAARLVESQRHRIDVAYADLLPSLDLTGDLSYLDEPSAGLDYQRRATVGLQLNIPLYQGGLEYSQVRENRQTLLQRQGELENSVRSVQQQVTTAWEQLIAARAAIEALKAQVDANRIALDGVQEEAQVGQRTVLDVLDAEQELFESQVDLVRAQRVETVASYQLKAAIGEMTVVGLDLDVDPYDAEAYFEQQRTRLFGIDTQ